MQRYQTSDMEGAIFDVGVSVDGVEWDVVKRRSPPSVIDHSLTDGKLCDVRIDEIKVPPLSNRLVRCYLIQSLHG